MQSTWADSTLGTGAAANHPRQQEPLMGRAVSDCTAGEKRKKHKMCRLGAQNAVFLLAFGIIALLGEQPFSKGEQLGMQPSLQGREKGMELGRRRKRNCK